MLTCQGYTGFSCVAVLWSWWSEGIVKPWILHKASWTLQLCKCDDSLSSSLLFPVRWAVTVPFIVSLCTCTYRVLRDCAALGEPMASGPPSPSEGRRLGLLELLLGPLLVLLVSGLGPALGQKVYTNTWAVHIPGGLETADQIASKHGFMNYGHVSKKLRFLNSFSLHLQSYEV